MNGIAHTLILEIKVLALKNNYSLKQIWYSLIFLDETLVDMHASIFLCLLLLLFSNGVCVILPVLIDLMLCFEKKCITLKIENFCSKHQN